MSTTEVIIIYLAGVNLLGFLSMGIDKKRAKNHEWRISEAVLFFFAIIGGSIGSLLGMKLFRHKTKHKKFTIGIPVIIVLQIGLIIAMKIMPNIRIW